MRLINPENDGIFHPFRLYPDPADGEMDDFDYDVKYRDPTGFKSTKMYAVASWVCLTRIFLLAIDRKKEQKKHNQEWIKESIFLHDMLSRIPGNIAKEDFEEDMDEDHSRVLVRVVQCDACAFISAIQNLVSFGLADDAERSLRSTTGRTRAEVNERVDFDFPTLFAIPFNDSDPMAAALFAPLDLFCRRDVFHDAHERIGWLQKVKESTAKEAKATKGRRPKGGGNKAAEKHSVKEKEKILRERQISRADDETEDVFIERIADRDSKEPEEVQRILYAAQQWDYRRRKNPK